MITNMRINNPEQFVVYQNLAHDILHGDATRSRTHFIDAPAGTGKTYLGT